MKKTRKSAKRKVVRQTRRKSVDNTLSGIVKEKIIFRVLAITMVVSSVVYSLLLNQVVADVVVRKDINKDMVDISSEITDLELQYIARQNELDLAFALENGYEQPTGASKYIVRGKAPILTYSD